MPVNTRMCPLRYNAPRGLGFAYGAWNAAVLEMIAAIVVLVIVWVMA